MLSRHRYQVVATVVVVMTWGLSTMPAAATGPTSPIRPTGAHHCSSKGLRGVSDLLAGGSPGGYPEYAENCQGAPTTVTQFIQSSCSHASVMLKPPKAGKRTPCIAQADTCYWLARGTGKQVNEAVIACQPTLNLNALVTFVYRFSR